jgi:hypothetical protein
MKRYLGVIAAVLVAVLLASCTPTITIPDANPIDGSDVVIGRTAEGTVPSVDGPLIFEGGVTPLATAGCPTSKASWWPPCTYTAGTSGAYSAAAYFCGVGLNWYKGAQYPDEGTCMAGAIAQQPGISHEAREFYIVWLYQRIPTQQLLRDYSFALASIYAANFAATAAAWQAIEGCWYVAALAMSNGASPYAGALIQMACTTGFFIYSAYYLL